MTTIHTDLAAGRWQEMTLAEQLGNIGSEISRALRAKSIGNSQRKDAALDRALELFDLTIADPKHHERLKELCRAREVTCDFFYGKNQYLSTDDSINIYFTQFALAARNHINTTLDKQTTHW